MLLSFSVPRKPVLSFNFGTTVHDFHFTPERELREPCCRTVPYHLASFPVADPQLNSFSTGKFQTWDGKHGRRVNLENTV